MKILVRQGQMICEVPFEPESDIIIQDRNGEVVRLWVDKDGAVRFNVEPLPDWAKERLQ